MNKNKTSALVTMFVAIFAFVITIAVPAQAASGTAILSRNITLATNPPDNAFATMDRNIYLASGWYDWRVSFTTTEVTAIQPVAPLASAARRIYIAAGTYSWSCGIYKLLSNINYGYESNCGLSKGYPAPTAGLPAKSDIEFVSFDMDDQFAPMWQKWAYNYSWVSSLTRE